MTEKTDKTAELLQAILAASDEKKDHLLRLLRGEIPETARPLVGPLLLGMGEAARFLGTSRSTLWRVLEAGTIPRIELFPGSFRVRREDLLKLAAGEFGLSEKKSRRGRPKGSRSQKTEVRCQFENDPRFRALKDKADAGDECAVSDLFKEFQFDHGAGRFTDPRTSRTDRTSGTNGQEIRA